MTLLRVGAAAHQRPGEDLGPSDQRSADAQRCPRELFGRDDHREVIVGPAGREAPEFFWYRQAESADRREALDDLLGDIRVVTVNPLCCRANLVVGETPEGLGHQLKVVVEAAIAFGRGQVGNEARVAVHQHIRPNALRL